MTLAPPRAVVFDDTALLALDSGSPTASRIIVEAHHDPSLRVFVPALCLTWAEVAREGVAEHVGSLPCVDITELDFPGITTVASRIRKYGRDVWGGAHALQLARPSVEWPLGRPVVTADPGRYQGTGIRTITLPELTD